MKNPHENEFMTVLQELEMYYPRTMAQYGTYAKLLINHGSRIPSCVIMGTSLGICSNLEIEWDFFHHKWMITG